MWIALMRIPKLRRNPDGRAFVEIPKSGRKRLYLGKHGTAEAENAYKAWAAQFLTQPVDRSSRQLVHGNIASLILEYLQEHKPQMSRSGYSSARKALMLFGDVFADKSPHDIGPRMLESFKQSLLDTTYKKGKDTRHKYSAKTMNDHLKSVKRFVKWACRMEYLPPERYAGLSTVEGVRSSQGRETQDVAPVPWSEVKKTLPFLPSTVAAMVQVQFLCGMRPNEVRRMRAGDIDTSGDIWLYTPQEHKNTHRGQQLTKAIPEPAQALLKPFMDKTESEYLFDPKDATREARVAAGGTTEIDDSKPLQPGECYATTSYTQAVKRAIGRARKADVEIEDWRPAQLRHSIATEIRQKLGQQAAQVYLGHANLDTTAIYAERTVKELLQVAGSLDYAELTS